MVFVERPLCALPDLGWGADTDADGKLDSAQLKRFRDSLTPGQPPDFAAHGAMMAEIGAPGGLVAPARRTTGNSGYPAVVWS